jgi:hypothetical protein
MRHSHNVRRLVTVAILAAGLTLSGCLGSSYSHHTPTTTTTLPTTKVATRVPSGDVAIDIGMVRLIAPLSWTLRTAVPICGLAVGCTAPCGSGASAAVVVTTVAPRLACPTATRKADSVWVFPLRGKPGAKHIQLHNGTVVRSVPSLGVVLYGFGSLGARIVRDAGPSSLAALLSARLPVAVPNGWKTVSFGPLAVSVPRSWPLRFLTGRSWPIPGFCVSPVFPQPVAYLGAASDAEHSCPIIDAQTILSATAHPGDGIWLTVGQGAAVEHPFFPPVGQLITVKGLRVKVRLGLPGAGGGSDTVEVLATVGRTSVVATLGLGINPRVAEDILSSIRPYFFTHG